MAEREIQGLVIEKGQFLGVPAFVEDLKDSYLLLVNTGEPRCSLSPKIMDYITDRLNLQPVGVTISQGNSEFWYHFTISVGSVQKAHVPVVAQELPTWIGADGVLGMNWFRLVEPRVSRMTLDFKSQTLGLDFV